MGPYHLEMNYWDAGSHYLIALERLGLRPKALFWADDTVLDHKVLVLVTDILDIIGPLKLSQLLLRAYNLAATPAAIDPFVVRLHSPQQAVIREAFKMWPMSVVMRDEEGRDITESTMRSEIRCGSLKFDPSWVYRFERKSLSAVDAGRQSSRFQRNIENLAA